MKAACRQRKTAEADFPTGITAAAGDVHMHARRRRRLADVLTAVRMKTPLAQCGRSLAPNAERHLRPLYRLARIYPTELLMQTQAIAGRLMVAAIVVIGLIGFARDLIRSVPDADTTI